MTKRETKPNSGPMRREQLRRVNPWALAAALIACWIASPLCGRAQNGRAQDGIAQDRPMPVSQDSDAAWLADLNQFREQRAREIDAPNGWLTLVGMEWLKTGANAFGAAADNSVQLHAAGAPGHFGVLAVSDNAVALEAPTGGFPADLQVDGKPAKSGPLVATGAKPSTITWHSLSMVVLDRGGRYALQIKDANSPARTAFRGLYWFAPNEQYRVEAKWTPYVPPHIEKIPTALGTTLDLPSPGVAEFTLFGMPFRLEPVLEDPQGKTLFWILRDQTRYETTYEAARYLHTGLPDHGLERPGSLTLDFNRLENPPCAYSAAAVCPLPPVDNRLLTQITAGEKRYSH